MRLGQLNQKASSPLVIFVLGCSVITVGLLWSMQAAVARGGDYYENNPNYIGYLKN